MLIDERARARARRDRAARRRATTAPASSRGTTSRRSTRSGLNAMFVPEAYGGAPMSYAAYLECVREISKACASTGVIWATNFHCDEAAHRFRHRGAEAAAAAGDGGGRAGLAHDHRTERRLGRDRHEDRRSGPTATHIVVTGDKTLHHQRRARRSLSAVRQVERDRRRPQGDLGAGVREGHAGAQRRARGRQDGPARLQHRGAGVRRLPRAARESARRAGRRAEDPARLAQQVAAERRRACARHRARRVRGRGRLHQRAPAVGPPHRRVPGHPVHAGGHGDRSRAVRGVAVARRAAGRRAARPISASKRRC